MTQAAKAQEPSMEEILASIRRIIADDDATKTPQRAPEPPKAAPRPAAPPPPAPVEPEVEEPEPVAASADVESEAADILDLTESMAAPSFSEPDPEPEPSPAPQFRKIEGISDVSFDESEQKPTVARDEPGAGQLLSSATSAAVDSAFNTLAHTVLVQNARTLEDLVREMLRPMLKTWLDDNLPSMVERLVRAEIERVARGRAN
jgi:cell pole-organizing protein PopZ